MLSEDTVEYVLKLVRTTDLSQFAIALRAGCSKATVNAIVKGQREGLERDVSRPIKAVKLHKCKGCGGNITTEICILCRDRREYGRLHKCYV